MLDEKAKIITFDIIFYHQYCKSHNKEIEIINNVDQGYKKLIVTSDGRFIGKEFEELYERISNKKQSSRNFKDLLIERDKKINEVINKVDFRNVKHN